MSFRFLGEPMEPISETNYFEDLNFEFQTEAEPGPLRIYPTGFLAIGGQLT
jgi:hypothetical protein